MNTDMYVSIPREPCKQDPQLEARLRRLVADAAAAVEAEESTIWLISADGQFLLGAINHGRTPEIVEAVDQPITPPSSERAQSIIGLVLQLHNGLCKGPEDAHDTAVDARTATATRTMAAVPIDIGQSVVGVLSAINRREGRLFDNRSLEELQWRAYLVGLVLRDYGADAGRGSPGPDSD